MFTQAHPTTSPVPTTSPARFWLAATLLTLVLGSVWIWVSAPGRTSAVLEDSAGPFIGHAAPPIQLVSLEDPTVANVVNGVEVPVVLNFWASWCNPCRREIPELVEATQRFGQEVRVVGIVMPSDAEGARTMAAEFGINYELTVDAAGGRGHADYDVRSIPTTYFIDRSGVIRAKVTGEMSAAVLTEGISRILN
ncbi:MAG: TlpA family protein disulfide reductase [Caldilineaceae bacterium SB0665_bin_21]|nr:TlpA family protein disulfide reductase [Caldilineaceae bacterium SB0665_bin_21]MYA06094.1 TlpA family protein disulfide reductase [Caldilineaceae bacterium SB0664_bin_22]MYC63154.1 TlpA family protein disulfide reductase [Caldilineaceae bacterium SB0661_bin_34]